MAFRESTFGQYVPSLLTVTMVLVTLELAVHLSTARVTLEITLPGSSDPVTIEADDISDINETILMANIQPKAVSRAKSEVHVIIEDFIDLCDGEYPYNSSAHLLYNLLDGKSKNRLSVGGNESYTEHVQKLKSYGEAVAAFVRFLRWFLAFELKDVHLIGIGMGANIAGMAAENLTRVGSITGLDVIGAEVPRKFRLKKSQADFVNVIRTNVGDPSLGFLGSNTTAHATFIINGGSHQAGCSNEYIPGNRCMDPCSHKRAYTLLYRSYQMGNEYAIAKACNRYANRRYVRFGRILDTNVTGKYCIDTQGDFLTEDYIVNATRGESVLWNAGAVGWNIYHHQLNSSRADLFIDANTSTQEGSSYPRSIVRTIQLPIGFRMRKATFKGQFISETDASFHLHSVSIERVSTGVAYSSCNLDLPNDAENDHELTMKRGRC